MNTHELFVEKKFSEVKKLIQPRLNLKILDIGCHDAAIIKFLPKCEYYGIDIDPKEISKLKKQGVNAEIADLNKDPLPFQKERFDYILLLDVLEHVINPKQLLKDTKELLKPRGKIITTLPNDYHLLNKLRFITNKHLTEDPFAPYGHLHYFPIKSGEAFLKQSNLKIIKKINIPPVKPKILPQSIKNLLTTLAPQSFARDVLYLLKINIYG